MIAITTSSSINVNPVRLVFMANVSSRTTIAAAASRRTRMRGHRASRRARDGLGRHYRAVAWVALQGRDRRGGSPGSRGVDQPRGQTGRRHRTLMIILDENIRHASQKTRPSDASQSRRNARSSRHNRQSRRTNGLRQLRGCTVTCRCSGSSQRSRPLSRKAGSPSSGNRGPGANASCV